MNAQEYDKCVDELTKDRTKVAEGKREDYTRGDEDVLANFKNQAEALGIDPKVSLAVHMEKQFSAVLNYIKTDGESESEPIIKRIGDTINYLELLWGLINEKDNPRQLTIFDTVEGLDTEKLKEEWESFSRLVKMKTERDLYEGIKKYYPETPDEAFHQTRIATIKFRLRTDVPNIGTKGWVLETSKPSNFEFVNEHGETEEINLFTDERFEEVE